MLELGEFLTYFGAYMKLLLLICILTFSTFAFSITKGEVEQALRQMEESGAFSNSQISAARKQLGGDSSRTEFA
jgi:hypothetical protein